MECANLFCIYWKDEQCTVDEISLDIVGNCTACIYVDIEEKILQQAREHTLRSCGDA